MDSERTEAQCEPEWVPLSGRWLLPHPPPRIATAACFGFVVVGRLEPQLLPHRCIRKTRRCNRAPAGKATTLVRHAPPAIVATHRWREHADPARHKSDG